MIRSRLQDIKQAQKESFLHHELASFFTQIALDNPELSEFCIVRVKLSDRKSFATIYFSCPGGQAEFDAKVSKLILYKPSLRNSLSKVMHSRYCPNLAFKFDAPLEKQRVVEDLIESLKSQGKL